jgi:hypothetical protein
MMMNAWLIGSVDKKNPSKSVGFRPPALTGQIPNLVDLQTELEDGDEDDTL